MAPQRNVGAPFIHSRDLFFGPEPESAPARINLTYEELSIDSILHTTTLSLYRERAKDIRAIYEQMWRCFAGNRVTVFTYNSHEGDGDDVSRIINLHDCVNYHVRLIENLRIRAMRNAKAAKRWKSLNRSGGVLKKEMRSLPSRNGGTYQA